MRILIATPLYPPDIGGPAKYALELERAFRTVGYTAHAVAYGRFERSLPPGVRHLAFFFRLARHAARADIVLALDTWSVGLPALATSTLFRKKLLVRVGGDIIWESYVERTGELVKLSAFYAQPHRLSAKERLMQSGVRLLGRQAMLLFTTSWQRELWVRAYELDAGRIGIVENEYPAPQRVQVSRKKIFVAAGRTIVLKNMPALRKAFAVVKERHPDIVLDTRALPPADHLQRVASCYAVIVPTISEVNSNAVIEGSSLGKPFIMSEDSGGRDRLAGAGIFTDTTNPDAMAEAIDALLDPATYDAYVAASRRVQPYSWDEIAAAYIAAARRYKQPRIFKELLFSLINGMSALLPHDRAAVLLYHDVGESPLYLTVSPERFASQMQYLSDRSYQVLRLRELVDILETKRRVPPRSVVLTFDDGYLSHLNAVLPVLEQFGFPATFFVTTGIGGGMLQNSEHKPQPVLDSQGIAKLAASPLADVEPHSRSHREFPALTPEDERSELESRADVEAITGKRCFAFAYPRGAYTGRSKAAARAAGYRCAVSTRPGLCGSGSDLFALARNTVNGEAGSQEFRGALTYTFAILHRLRSFFPFHV